MSIEKIKPVKVRRGKGILYRLWDSVVFILRNRLVGSRLFLILYLLYTITVVIGTVFLVFFSDLLLTSSNFLSSDPISIYYSLVVLGFSLTTMNDLAFWVIAFSAANLLSEDIKGGLVVTYYSKPVPRFFYLASRVTAVLFLLFFIALIPLGVMVTVPVLRHPDSFPSFSLGKILEVMFLSIAASLLVFLFYIFLVSTIIVLVEERGASVLVAFIIYYTSYLSSLVLSIYLGNQYNLISLNFWAASIILVALGIPWMDLDETIFSTFGSTILQIDLRLNPVYYLVASTLLISLTLILGAFSFYLYNKRALLGEEQ